MYNSKIIGFGKYLPNNIVTNDDLSKIMDTNDEWISTRTGIKQRHFSKEENTSKLCTNVAKEILEKAKIDPKDIDLIIVATFTPDYATPSVACIVQSEIGAENASAFDLNAACSGFVFALSVADKYIKSGMYKRIMVIGGEVISKTLNFEDRSTAVIFGDGAGGVLLEATTEDYGIIYETLEAKGDVNSIRGEYFGVKNFLFEEDCQSKSKYLEMNGREVLGFVSTLVVRSVLKILDKAQMSVEDISYVVPHQANYRISEILAKKMKCDISKVYTNIQNMGNTSAASIPIALCEMLESGKISLGSKEVVLMTGFGSGLTCGTMLFKL